jgi:hypothetical protein
MKKISSKSTFLYKRIFPLFWFGFVAFFFASAIGSGSGVRHPVFLGVPILLGVFGFFLMKKLVWSLADEVYDNGDHLIVKKGGEQEVVPLSRIINVSVSENTNPRRVTLRLARDCRFGGEVSFTPVGRLSLNPFAKIEVAEDLIVRVDRARADRTD